jgi:hypothetical protein
MLDRSSIVKGRIAYPFGWQSRPPYFPLREGKVPRIPQLIRDCVFYAYRSMKDATDKEPVGGSGFLVGVRSSTFESRFYVYSVTNRHVVERANWAPVIRINRDEGAYDLIETDPDNWHTAIEDDIAVYLMPGPAQTTFFYSFVMEDMFLTKEEMKKFSIGPGDEVFFIGRFVNHEGKEQNWPALRFGRISMMPSWGLVEIGDGSRQESFLVEGHSVSGYSGSPVFVYIEPWVPRFGIAVHATEDGAGIVGFEPSWWRLPKFAKKDWPREFIPTWLLGVDWGHLTVPLEDEPKIRVNSGMVGVVPAWKLRDLLYGEELMEARRRGDAQLEKEKDRGAALDALLHPEPK